jgi:hypothetical protein
MNMSEYDTSKNVTINFYSDSAHGWAKVSINEIKELGIAKDITTYSYMDMTDDSVYLEEDYDLGLYINAIKEQYGNDIDINFVEHKSREDENGLSCIRDYPRYRSN